MTTLMPSQTGTQQQILTERVLPVSNAWLIEFM